MLPAGVCDVGPYAAVIAGTVGATTRIDGHAVITGGTVSSGAVTREAGGRVIGQSCNAQLLSVSLPMALPHLITERLRLRPVMAEDLDVAVALGADARVMAWFGGPMAAERAAAWMGRQLDHWQQHGFGRMALDRDGVVVGFVGLTRTDFDAAFTPGVEIAWRLAFEHWGKGYATEAARAVVQDGFDRLGLDEIVGVTTPGNMRSRRVMERLGMVQSPGDTFEHPLVPEGDPLRLHVVYRLSRP